MSNLFRMQYIVLATHQHSFSQALSGNTLFNVPPLYMLNTHSTNLPYSRLTQIQTINNRSRTGPGTLCLYS